VGTRKGTPKGRTYTAEVHEAAVAAAMTKGPAAAAREMKLPRGTVSNWLFLAKQALKAEAEKTATTAARSEQLMGKAVPQALPSKPPEPVAPAAAGAEAAGRKSRPARVYTPSERARALETVAKFGVSRASKMLSISRFTLYEWHRKVALAAAGKITDALVSGHDADIAVERDRKILAEWKQHPGLGPSQIRNQLRRRGTKVSVHTTRRVMEENGYLPPKVRREGVHDRDFEATRPNHLWHLDFFQRFIHKQSVYVLLIIDDYSRFIVGGSVWESETSAAVLTTFEGAVGRHGRPELVMSDGGSAFWAWRGVAQFTRLLEELDVDQLLADVPEKNGKSEILNANAQKELFNQEMFFDVSQAERRLASWIAFYNFRRTHHALGGLLVPADRYFGRVDEVLAQIEAGRSAETVGEPIPVGERELDVLRVVSHKGQLTLTVMGKQVWPARS
jgi:putative transposase